MDARELLQIASHSTDKHGDDLMASAADARSTRYKTLLGKFAVSRRRDRAGSRSSRQDACLNSTRRHVQINVMNRSGAQRCDGMLPCEGETWEWANGSGAWQRMLPSAVVRRIFNNPCATLRAEGAILRVHIATCWSSIVWARNF